MKVDTDYYDFEVTCIECGKVIGYFHEDDFIPNVLVRSLCVSCIEDLFLKQYYERVNKRDENSK